jgi:putative DNA primase/helicase
MIDPTDTEPMPGELAPNSSEPDPEPDPHPEPATGARPLFPPPSAPYDVAKRLYNDFLTADRMAHLMAWRGGWMVWRTTNWTEVDVADLRQPIYATLSHAEYEHVTKADVEIRPWNPDKHKVANVMEALAAVVHLSSEIDPPAWINGHSETESDAARMISCANGLLDLSTRTLIDHTPALFNYVSVPFAYDADAPKPTEWEAFLETLWADDPDSIALLQEYFGYVLSGRLDMQKMLTLIGPIRSGKGTIARTLERLMGGRRNVAAPTLASLGTNFGLSSLLGKPLAVISDARLGNTPGHVVVERLLSITGEDMLDVDRKHRDIWTGKLPTRFVMLTNELPKFRDSSGAIATRMLFLKMTESFLGREDHELDDKLTPELRGILSWALEGLDRLNSNGKFTVPKSSEDTAALMMDLASPISAFVRECCVRNPHAIVGRDELYAAWQKWAFENGHIPGAKSTFGRDLHAVVPDVKETRPWVEGERIRYYTRIGLSLGPPGPDGGDAFGPGSLWTNGEVKPQVSDPGPGGPGESPMRVYLENPVQDDPGPNGADPTASTSGRQLSFCRGCGYYFATNGHHRADCMAVGKPAKETH